MVVAQPTEDGLRNDLAGRGRLPPGFSGVAWDLLGQALVRPSHVEVLPGVLAEHAPQVVLSENEDVVEALAPKASATLLLVLRRRDPRGAAWRGRATDDEVPPRAAWDRRHILEAANEHTLVVVGVHRAGPRTQLQLLHSVTVDVETDGTSAVRDGPGDEINLSRVDECCEVYCPVITVAAISRDLGPADLRAAKASRGAGPRRVVVAVRLAVHEVVYAAFCPFLVDLSVAVVVHPVADLRDDLGADAGQSWEVAGMAGSIAGALAAHAVGTVARCALRLRGAALSRGELRAALLVLTVVVGGTVPMRRAARSARAAITLVA